MALIDAVRDQARHRRVGRKMLDMARLIRRSVAQVAALEDRRLGTGCACGHAAAHTVSVALPPVCR
jgi:hypothetical protein